MGLKSRAVEWLVERKLRKLDRDVREGKVGEAMQTWWPRLVQFMDGKKLYTGVVLTALPLAMASLAGILVDNGFDPLLAAKYTAWGTGSVLIAVGAIHKVVKFLDDLTPSNPPEKK